MKVTYKNMSYNKSIKDFRFDGYQDLLHT
jgi:hypothetical protein